VNLAALAAAGGAFARGEWTHRAAEKRFSQTSSGLVDKRLDSVARILS
jgi:hypothetical protein